MSVPSKDYFTPTEGEVYRDLLYENCQCVKVMGKYCAVMRDMITGWTFTFHGINRRRSGAIDHDRHTDFRDAQGRKV